MVIVTPKTERSTAFYCEFQQVIEQILNVENTESVTQTGCSHEYVGMLTTCKEHIRAADSYSTLVFSITYWSSQVHSRTL